MDGCTATAIPPQPASKTAPSGRLGHCHFDDKVRALLEAILVVLPHPHEA